MSQEQTNSAGMSQLQRLKALQEENKAKSQKTNMTAFNELVGIYVGTPTRPHYPKLRDKNGKVTKSEKGRANEVMKMMAILMFLLNLVLQK